VGLGCGEEILCRCLGASRFVPSVAPKTLWNGVTVVPGDFTLKGELFLLFVKGGGSLEVHRYADSQVVDRQGVEGKVDGISGGELKEETVTNSEVQYDI
jgi:hypothetical protein